MASGNGQKRPAGWARFSVSRTVERAMPSRRAISCVDTDDAFSRIISRAWRILIRSAGTDRSLGLPKGRPDQANGGAHQSTKDPGRDHSVMGGAIISESGGGIIPLRGAASSRNWGAASSGISSQLGYLLAITDSGFNPFLDQPLLCVDKLCRAFHRRQRPHRGGQLIDILRCQFLIRPGQLLNGGSRSVAVLGESSGGIPHGRVCCFAALG